MSLFALKSPIQAVLASPDFITVDFETATKVKHSACQVSLVHMRNGQVKDKLTTLLKPAVDGAWEFTYIHNITPQMVHDAPTWQDIAAQLANFVRDYPVWAHNARFDAAVWEALDDYYRVQTFPGRVWCTLTESRKTFPGLSNYKLPTVTHHCSPGFVFSHHQAEDDALACAHIVLGLQRTYEV